MGRLDGKVCLITGAAKGQGACEARRFAQEGAVVWTVDVLDAPGEALASEIGGTYRHLDVTDEAAWAALVAEIMAEHGRIDVLINNAGIYRTGKHFELATEDFQQVMDVNCLGVFLGLREVSRVMRDAGSGSIVNISSVAGLQGGMNAFAYFTSKWAVRGMTKAAAMENARRNVRVNSIHPGVIETDMMRDLPNSDEARIARSIPMGRTAQAEEVANLALYLASDESSYSTGSEFVVDGGMHAI